MAEPSEFERLVELAGGKFERTVAADVWPNGATLCCKKCDYERHATTLDCGTYLAHGWPKHCGVTMTLD